ncbi:MAG: EAL domain-containing protein [Actinobacteria bacterium]|nr:MAG: EAL domain-containing protein [Actinomycetota bacterium]
MSATETSAVPRRALGRRFRVPGLIAAAAAAAAVLYYAVLAGLGPPDALAIPWWGLALAFFLAEAFPVHVHFRSEAHSLSLSELALVLGLYAAPPGELLLAMLLGTGLALLVVRRQRPLKLAFNLASFAVATSLALLVFHGFLTLGDAYGPAGWAGAAVGAVVYAVAGVLLVSAVIWLAAARSTVGELATLIRVAVCGSLASGSLAVAAIELARFDARSLWVLAVPAAGTALAFRAYTIQRRRHEHLEFLYRSMRAMQGSSEFRSSVRELLEAARSMLSADVAEIVLFPRSAEKGALRSVIASDGEILMEPIELDETSLGALQAVSAQESAALLPRGRRSHALDAYLAGRGLSDAIVTALHGADRVFGMALVGDRSGDVATFNGDDRKLFETFASHAGVLLENDRVKEQLRHQAFHDGLTGLPNRQLFADQVGAALSRSFSSGRASVVLFVDLDDFKTINDTLGHSAGDYVLVAVAERVRASLRPGDLAARLGGDEFAILLERSDREGAEILASRLLDALRMPFVVEGRELALHASIGIANAGPADDAEDLLRNADVAMYSAKTNGKGGSAWYEPEMHVRIRRRQELASALERAVDRDELDVHYQPIVALATGGVVAFEALARWRHPERGLVLPETFIPLAEDTGLMAPIGRAILRRACEQLRSWRERERFHDELRVSVNLSQSELRSPNLIGDVEEILARTSVPPDRLILEITESSAMHDPAATIETLTSLRRLGVRFALDDFGTGYSSLSHLRQFPIDMLKIAKPFVDRIDRDGADGTFVDAILRLAAALDLDVVAEGIERREQVEVLRELNCGLGQGFHYARPAAVADVEARLSARPIRAA